MDAIPSITISLPAASVPSPFSCFNVTLPLASTVYGVAVVFTCNSSVLLTLFPFMPSMAALTVSASAFFANSAVTVAASAFLPNSVATSVAFAFLPSSVST